MWRRRRLPLLEGIPEKGRARAVRVFHRWRAPSFFPTSIVVAFPPAAPACLCFRVASQPPLPSSSPSSNITKSPLSLSPSLSFDFCLYISPHSFVRTVTSINHSKWVFRKFFSSYAPMHQSKASCNSQPCVFQTSRYGAIQIFPPLSTRAFPFSCFSPYAVIHRRPKSKH